MVPNSETSTTTGSENPVYQQTTRLSYPNAGGSEYRGTKCNAKGDLPVPFILQIWSQCRRKIQGSYTSERRWKNTLHRPREDIMYLGRDMATGGPADIPKTKPPSVPEMSLHINQKNQGLPTGGQTTTGKYDEGDGQGPLFHRPYE